MPSSITSAPAFGSARDDRERGLRDRDRRPSRRSRARRGASAARAAKSGVDAGRHARGLSMGVAGRETRAFECAAARIRGRTPSGAGSRGPSFASGCRSAQAAPPAARGFDRPAQEFTRLGQDRARFLFGDSKQGRSMKHGISCILNAMLRIENYTRAIRQLIGPFPPFPSPPHPRTIGPHTHTLLSCSVSV